MCEKTHHIGTMDDRITVPDLNTLWLDLDHQQSIGNVMCPMCECLQDVVMFIRHVWRAFWVFDHIVELCVFSGANAQSSHFRELQLVWLNHPVAEMHLKL